MVVGQLLRAALLGGWYPRRCTVCALSRSRRLLCRARWSTTLGAPFAVLRELPVRHIMPMLQLPHLMGELVNWQRLCGRRRLRLVVSRPRRRAAAVCLGGDGWGNHRGHCAARVVGTKRRVYIDVTPCCGAQPGL